MAISDVQLKNNYYQVIDENGRKIKEIHASSVGDLLGIGIDFIVFHKNHYYATYDDNFRKIKEVYESNLGSFKNVAGVSINFIKNNYFIAAYDKYFNKKSEKHI